MAVKYYCPKCDRRFIDWGAEKLKFQCPDCEGEKLVEVGRAEGAPAVKRPTLRRKKKKAAPPPPPPTAAAFKDEDASAPDLNNIVGASVDGAVDTDFDDSAEEVTYDDDAEGEIGDDEAVVADTEDDD